MYLSMLNDSQKKIFLGLAYHLSNADGDYSLHEQEMMKSYYEETGIEFDEKVENKSIETLLAELKNNFDLRNIKIIIFELIGLAMVDDDYSDDERAIIKSISIQFTIGENILNEYENLISEYIFLQNKINNAVLI